MANYMGLLQTSEYMIIDFLSDGKYGGDIIILCSSYTRNRACFESDNFPGIAASSEPPDVISLASKKWKSLQISC